MENYENVVSWLLVKPVVNNTLRSLIETGAKQRRKIFGNPCYGSGSVSNPFDDGQNRHLNIRLHRGAYTNGDVPRESDQDLIARFPNLKR
eukprot:scaffold34646_cov173-Amphora_coffeaeformis.AAC.29